MLRTCWTRLRLGLSYRAYLSKASYNRPWEPQPVAAQLLRLERSPDQAGGSTIGGIMLRRGQTTLLAELRVDPRWKDQPLPSCTRIAALLSAEQLTRRYQKHSELPVPVIQVAGAPHDEWELDAASEACT